MDFSERVSLCKRAFSVDLRDEELSASLKNIIQNTDLFVAVSSVGYIGDNFFHQAFSIINENHLSPLFAFTAYRTFYPTELEKVFNDNGYSIIKSNIPLAKGRRFVSVAEQEEAIRSLHKKNIDTKNLENDG